MKCLKGYKDCKCEHYNPLRELKDLILWKEVWFMLILLTVCILSMGVFGLAVAYAIDTLTKANGGNVMRYDSPEPKIKHTENEECLKDKHTYCKIL